MRLLSSLKSDIVRTVLSFLSMINAGDAHHQLPLQHSNVAQPLSFLHENGFMFVQERVRPDMVWLHAFLWVKGYRQ
jgi:hypothetical protein